MNYLSKENVQAALGLSLWQEQLYTSETSEDHPIHAVTQVKMAVPADVDSELFQAAWGHLITLHPALRTVFRAARGKVFQAVLKQRPVPLEVQDLRGKSDAEQAAMQAETALRHRDPFPLGEGPLLRPVLFLAEGTAEFLLTYHPILLDELSRDRVLTELWKGYQTLAAGGALTGLQEPSHQGYLAWQAGQDRTPLRQFWKERLASFELPTPFFGQRSEVEGDGKREVLTAPLSAELADALEKLALDAGVSMATLIGAAWAMLLQVYSREDEVTFGFAFDGRTDAVADCAALNGRFGGVLPVRIAPGGEMTVRELLQAVQEQTAQLNPIAYTPLQELCKYAGLPADTRFFTSAMRVQTVEAAVLYDGNAAPLLDVALTAGERWKLTVSYAADAVEGSAVQSMAAHLQTLLTSLTAQPHARLADLNLVPDAEREEMFGAWIQSQQKAYPLDRMAHQVIEEQAVKTPQKIAAVCGAEQLTYQVLNQRANRLAHFLRENGVGRDDLAALFAERGLEMLTAILAVLKAGAAYVPLDSAHPDTRLATIVETAGAKVILTQNELKARSAGLSEQAVLFSLDDLDTLTAYSDQNLAFVNEPHDLANVFFTSGSTGLPKGAMVEHIGMLNHLFAKIDLLEMDESSVVAQNASHCFDISVWQFLAPLMTGGTVVIYDNDTAMDPHALMASVQQDRVTILEMVPAVIEMFLQAVEEDVDAAQLPDLRYMLSTGEALRSALCARWLHAYPQVKAVNTYGATECSDDTSHKVITAEDGADLDRGLVTLGTPIPNFKAYVLDPGGRPVPAGCTGEICLTGVGVGRGYLNDRERTEAAFVKNPFADGMGERMYKTGDLGRFLPDGRLEFVSRADFQVKVRGHRIELGEVEAALLAHVSVGQCVAVVRPDGAGQNRLLAYTVLSTPVEMELLRGFLQDRLPEYMIPEHIVTLDALPLNRNGKVDRKALPEPDAAVRVQVKVEPETALETALVSIWEEVLEQTDVGVEDDFFALGGHSLKMIQVRSRVKQALGLDVSLRSLFELSTIRELAALLEGLQGGDASAQTISRLGQQDVYAMSHGQKRLYLLERLENSQNSYHQPVALELGGNLDIPALKRAFQTIVDRHGTLRTIFPLVEGEPVQQVLEHVVVECPVIDLTQWAEAEQDAELQRLLQAEHSQAFDLEQETSFQVRLYKLGEERHLVSLNLHHIISDGWSGEVLLEEMGVLYEAYHQGADNPLAPLTVQYTDYAHWQNQRFQNGDLAEAERYWLEQFQGELPQLDLPADHPRPNVQTFGGASASLKLSGDVLEKITRTCREQEATSFMGLLTVFAVFLSKLSGQKDIVIGTPEAGRTQVELEELIGFFVNTLALRLDLSGNPTFAELLERVKQVSLNAYAYQEYPFDLLVEKVNPVRDPARSPLFSVMFQTVQAGKAQTFGGLTLRSHQAQEVSALFDLCLTCVEKADGLEIVFDYNVDLFAEETISRWLKHFESLLQAVGEGGNLPISDLSLLTAKEREQLLESWSVRESNADVRLLHERLEEQAARTPEAIALTTAGMVPVESLLTSGESLTYRELNERANRVAGYLLTLGVGSNTPVGLCVAGGPEFVIGQLGILKAGGAFVPLDPAYPQERLSYIQSDANIKVVLTAESIRGASHTDAVAVPVAARADQTAYLLYTSGSTGLPKGVLVPHAALSHFVSAIDAEYSLQRGDRVLQFASTAFDVAVEEIWPALTAGAEVVFLPQEARQSLDAFTAFVREQALTVLNLPAAFFGEWVNHLEMAEERVPEQLRLMIVGSDKLPPRHYEAWQRLALASTRFLFAYGTTETTVTSTLYDPAAEGYTTGDLPIGRPLSNTEICLLDEHLQPVPLGVAGQLCIGGNSLADGYKNRADLTAEKFVPHPFKSGARLYLTGDAARYRPDGQLEFLGRLDSQVKLRGLRIELGEIEAALLALPSVREAAAQVLGEQLIGYAVTHGDATTAELRTALQRKLPAFMVPSQLILLDSMPRTPNGKLDRRALPEPDLQKETYTAPRDTLELQMVRLWEAILGTSPIGVHDHFFSVGGHSLKALQLASAVQKSFGAALPLSALFQTPTVAGLCAALRSQTESSSGCLVPLQTGTAGGSPLFLIHPQGGGVLSYFHLVQALGPEQAVYGLQAAGYETEAEPLTSLTEMADRYLGEILSVHADGPYRLAGWSFGGLVAYELALRLEALGKDVEFLGLLDVHPFDVEEEEADEKALLMFMAEHFGLDTASFEGLSLEEALPAVCLEAQASGALPPETTSADLKRKLDVLHACGQAAAGYRPHTTVRADLHFFTASVDPQGWQSYTKGDLIIEHVPGTHHSMIEPPHVTELVKHMKFTTRAAY